VGGALIGGRRLCGGSPETARIWVRRAEMDAGHRPVVSSEQADELAPLKRKNAEPRQRDIEGGALGSTLSDAGSTPSGK
jgi:transposase-like protein